MLHDDDRPGGPFLPIGPNDEADDRFAELVLRGLRDPSFAELVDDDSDPEPKAR